MVDRLPLEALLAPDRVHSRESVVTKRPSSVPSAPGLYAWYFEQAPPGIATTGCHTSEHGVLLYVGISPSPPPLSGKAPSQQNLHKRVRYHFTGNAEGSTLRLTLGCHLADALGMQLRRVGSGNRFTFTPTGEAALSAWMAEHARVAVVENAQPWMLERDVIHSVNAPLNIAHNAHHPYYVVNRALRAQHKAAARGLPIWSTSA